MKTLAGLVFLFSVIFFAVNAKEVCLLNQETMMRDLEQCLARNLGFDLVIMKHMNDPSSMMSVDFLCKYKSQIADLFECMIAKVADCVPEKTEQLFSMLPSKDQLLEAFKFICDHKKELNSDCLNGQEATIQQCLMKRFQQFSTMDLDISSDPQKVLCSIVRTQEQCIEQNKGKCSADFISLIEHILEMVYPLKHCPKIPSSILLRGEPLLFKPYKKDSGYVIQP